jgi:hypothetical protein
LLRLIFLLLYFIRLCQNFLFLFLHLYLLCILLQSLPLFLKYSNAINFILLLKRIILNVCKIVAFLRIFLLVFLFLFSFLTFWFFLNLFEIILDWLTASPTFMILFLRYYFLRFSHFWTFLVIFLRLNFLWTT